jgi:hypothetical protein
VSPRRSRPRGDDNQNARAVTGGTWLERTESYAGEEWAVRTVAGDSGKFYRCPGCDQEIPPRVGHVVAWPVHSMGAAGGVDDRRHWHRACWTNRERRAPNQLRGRGAPRY